MRSRLIVCSLVLALSALWAVGPAAAQDNAGDVFLGYTFLGNDDLAVNADTLPWGWAGGGGYRVNEWLSLAFDLSGSYRLGIDPCGIETSTLPDAACRVAEGVETPAASVEFQGLSFHRTEEEWCSPTLRGDVEGVRQVGPPLVPCNLRLNSVAVFGGPRIWMQTGNVKLFAHVMPGFVRSTRSIDFFTHTATNFALMPGGGVEFDVGFLGVDNMAVRVQGDYRRVFFPSPESSSSSLVSRNDFDEFRFMAGVVFRVGER